MKRVLLVSLLMLPPSAFAASPNGLWKTKTNDKGTYLNVEIAPCGAKICGTIKKVVNGTRSDLVGHEIIKDMSPDGTGAWTGGTILNPQNGKTYDASMKLNGNTLDVSGCAGVICRTQSWTRVD